VWCGDLRRGIFVRECRAVIMFGGEGNSRRSAVFGDQLLLELSVNLLPFSTLRRIIRIPYVVEQRNAAVVEWCYREVLCAAFVSEGGVAD
jgi:hypothetical protein